LFTRPVCGNFRSAAFGFPILVPPPGQRRVVRSLVHPWCVLVADFDRLSTFDVADHPSWFEDNPRVRLCRAGRAALRYLPATNEQENVVVLILANLANRCFVTHALRCNA